MDDQHQEKDDFYTKLSLPKFTALIRRLTPVQRELFCSIGLGHLLEISCEVLPRRMIRYLVSIFDARSRTLNIPKGPAVVITALLIHQVLGTPIGGRQIGEKVDADLRLHISNVTSCKGRYPKISELDCLITADLVGDLFKIVFGMYAMTAFLCPSSHDAVSPDYLHIFKEPDNIGSFDFSAAVLEKLVSSVEAHNDCLTSVLGGNLLSLLIIYLDFKDTNIVPVPLKWKLPRVAVWSTSMINAVESMDCISWDSAMYGNLPVKVVSDTPFTCNPITTHVTAKKSYDDLLNFVLSICPEVHHKLVSEQLPVIMSKMEKDIFESIQPIICQNIINVLKIIPSIQQSAQLNEAHNFQIVSPQFKVPLAGSIYKEDHVDRAYSNIGDTTSGALGFVAQHSGDVKAAETNTMAASTNESNDVTPSKHASEGNMPEMLVLPVPDELTIKRLDDEACSDGNFSVKSLIDSLNSIPQEMAFDIPYPYIFEESLYPQKVEISHVEGVVPTVVELVSYIVQVIESDSRVRKLMADKICTANEKVEVFNELFEPSQHQLASKEKKRPSWMSTNDQAVHCLALKKRARMFLINEPDASTLQVPEPEKVFVGVQFNVCGHSGGGNIDESSPNNSGKVANNDSKMTDEEFEKEFVNSAIKVEQEYYARKANQDFPTLPSDNVRVSEISFETVISSFQSTLVEQEVFNNIVSGIPKTARSKTIKIVVMGSTWVEHRVFGLSMQVYGKVHSYVINMLGKAVMVEDIERKNVGMTRENQWKRYIFECKIAALFQLEHEMPGKLAKLLSNGMLGFMLDSMDLIHLPLFTSGFHYLLVVNLKRKRFEVLIPNNKLHLVQNEAYVAIKNFKMSFSLAYKNSLVNINDMETAFRSVCSSDREGDSGIYVMKLICDFDGDNTLCFQPEHAKPLRESLTYYMVAHPFNEKMPLETRKILQKHNIPHDYKTPGYFPWMHEKNALNHEDPLESILKF